MNLKEIAYSQLEEAKDRVNFLENKVKHYEDIVSEKIADDTNPKKVERVRRRVTTNRVLDKAGYVSGRSGKPTP